MLHLAPEGRGRATPDLIGGSESEGVRAPQNFLKRPNPLTPTLSPSGRGSAPCPRYESRRSAVQVPEQAPPCHKPPPLLPARWPEPVALFEPLDTVTVMAPDGATLPLMVNGSLPPLTTAPWSMR